MSTLLIVIVSVGGYLLVGVIIATCAGVSMLREDARRDRRSDVDTPWIAGGIGLFWVLSVPLYALIRGFEGFGALLTRLAHVERMPEVVRRENERLERETGVRR